MRRPSDAIPLIRRRDHVPEPVMEAEMYEAVAQIAPVLLLAMVFESRFLETFDAVRRTGYWTARRVRQLGLLIVVAFLVAEATCLLVIGDLIGPSVGARAVVLEIGRASCRERVCMLV